MDKQRDLFPAFQKHVQPPEPFDLLKWTKEHLKTTSDIRDGLLITASVLYIVGYLVWSFNAWQNHLGLLSALDPQYFVAGLVPVVILLVAYLLGRYFRRFLIERWPVLVGKEAKGLGLVIRVVLLFIFWTTLALFFLGPVIGSLLLLIYPGYKLFRLFAPKTWDNLTASVKQPKGWRQAIVLILVILALLAFPVLLFSHDYFTRMILPGLGKGFEDASMIAFLISVTLLPPMDVAVFSLISQLYRWMWVYLGVLLFILLGFTFYLSSVYPNFPQEFGGVHPRCAYMDLVKSQLSDETLRGIVPPEAIASSQTVVRSLKVDILYSGSDVILVKSQGRVYEIAKGVNQAINVCY